MILQFGLDSVGCSSASLTWCHLHDCNQLVALMGWMVQVGLLYTSGTGGQLGLAELY